MVAFASNPAELMANLAPAYLNNGGAPSSF
jgi:hypothetical protein